MTCRGGGLIIFSGDIKYLNRKLADLCEFSHGKDVSE